MSRIRRSVTWASVRPILLVLVPLTVVATVWYVMTRPSGLPGEEVRRLLSGNTVEGGWGAEGSAYRQYFAPDGTTLYLGREGPERTGTWKVEADGTTCSAFQDEGEICLLVGRQDDGMLYWIDAGRGRGFPFAVLEGRKLAPGDGAQGRAAPEAMGAEAGLGQHAGF